MKALPFIKPPGQARNSFRGNKRSIPYPSQGEVGLDCILLNYHYVFFSVLVGTQLGVHQQVQITEGDATSET